MGRVGFAVGLVLNVVGVVQLIRSSGQSAAVWLAVGGWTLFAVTFVELIARVRRDHARQASGLDTAGSDAWLIEKASTIDSYAIGPRVVTDDGILKSTKVQWPDGVYGQFKTQEFAESGAINGYRVTYEPHGKPKKVIRQPAVTRDQSGYVVDRPQIVVEFLN